MTPARRSIKSRTGCQRCKSRRIKCDEGQPECAACTKSGFQCPGYGRALRWSRKHELAGSIVSSGASQHVGETIAPRPLTSMGNQSNSSASMSFVADQSTQPSPTHSGSGDWLSLGLHPYDAGLAFEDATTLMSQDLTGFTPLFLQNGPFPQDLAQLATDDSAFPTPQPHGAANLGGDEFPGLASSRQQPPSEHTSEGTNDTDEAKNKSMASGTSSRSTSLLQTFYRLSSPRTVPPLADDVFIRYFFKHIGRLTSCFDSDLNPFRTLVAQYMSSCQTVSLTIQSMALAHMCNWYPYLKALAIAKRSQCWRSLQRDLRTLRQDPRMTDRVLLSLLLLGASANWLHVNDLGLQYLHTTRFLVQNKLRRAANGAESDTLSEFWASCLVQWEALLSFVDNVPIATFDGHGMPKIEPSDISEGPIMPQPWTGVATDFWFALAEVGRVLRRRRRPAITHGAGEQEQKSVELDQRWLGHIENFLLSAKIPSQEVIGDYKDAATPKQDLIRMADVCRGVGLIEIYRHCPQLLQDRLANAQTADIFPFEVHEEHVGYSSATESMLADFSVQVLKVLLEVPLTSGASRSQPLLLVACSTQLRLPDITDADESRNGDECATRYDEITECRYCVEARMVSLSRKLAQAPILLAIDIIREVWDKLDAGEDTHWMDVMQDKGWQTVVA